MALTPNIDERGCRHRIRGGLAMLALGVLLLFAWAMPGGGALAWASTVLASAVGAFMIFEGRKSWCIARALGFKTRI